MSTRTPKTPSANAGRSGPDATRVVAVAVGADQADPADATDAFGAEVDSGAVVQVVGPSSKAAGSRGARTMRSPRGARGSGAAAGGGRREASRGDATLEDDMIAEPSDGDTLDTDLVEGEIVDVDARDFELPTRNLPMKADRTALSVRDPLAAYMRDVQRYSLLQPDEERELAVRYVETGDVEAARRLVTSNLRLVVKIAYDYRQAYRNLLDLVQEGNIGLMQAVKKYDPYKGVKLSSYAAWWIRAYMLRFILNNFRLVKVGTTQAQRKLFFNLKKEKARLEALGIEAAPELIAERLSVPVSEVISMDRRISSGESSLDKPVGNDETRAVARVEMLDGGSVPVDEMLADAEIHDRLRDKIDSFGAALTGKERIIFDDRLVSDEPLTLQELGDRFGVSRERVRQLEKRLLGKLKAHLEDTVDADVLDVEGS